MSIWLPFNRWDRFNFFSPQQISCEVVFLIVHVKGQPFAPYMGDKKQTNSWLVGSFFKFACQINMQKCWSVLLIENLFAFSFFSFGKSTAVHRAPGESKDNLPPFPFPGIHLQMFVCFTFPIIVLPVSQRCANDSGLLVQTCFETFWCSTRSKVARWSA